MNVDLETRLEEQAKLCIQAENESIEIDRNWKIKYAALERVLFSLQLAL